MDAGKLPNDLLARLLAKVQPRDPRVVLGPGIGRDAAVIDNGGPQLLVAQTDPTTFPTAPLPPAAEPSADPARLGMTADEIQAAKDCLFAPGISVLREAMAACEAVRV